MVANDETGESMDSEERTSSGMIIFETEDEIVSDVEARIAAWTFLPEENGEPIQILRYEHGQKYEAHIDYFMDKVNQEVGGHRVATVLMYLSDVNKGGETVFPASEAKGSQPKDDRWSDCAENGYAVKPNKGDALLFLSLHPDATPDPDSLHASCPVIEGEKWSATKWIHASVKGTLFIWWALTFITVTVGGAVRNANRRESFSVIFPPSLQRIHIFWEISLLPLTFTHAAALALVLETSLLSFDGYEFLKAYRR
ncbi:PROLYL 4-HYDROXYLASE ALPHA SUBUNIT [Salix purpurea]|uniref:procollagen-proline 4-dioxygenase n=1 Tax=Salix purpurea TaxID=77065 RepID=A0A9Q0WAN1_SALPP|nr:PROLYL 4-HYDROXYLASE ALPHA SUBUNIT [Salix purpurea]